MTTHIRSLATTFAMAGVACAVTLAPLATARPDCVNTAPNTTQCSTPGHTAIVTGPPPNMNPYNGWPGYGYGGFGGIGFGGIGFGGIGFRR
ncbi:MAG: hypothetical protein JWQ86_5371 [Mycobacterium sp.]|jgi:hypothetical protein|nr:hypothetical protein [Mycobacterium sp.]MDT5213332.1 hypothetical protein [Mycobacterium sp.]MDT5247767.1 hypothetical protein [Mycobacterium sp.]